MLQHYIKIAWRNVRRNKIYSAINILGLSAGIAFTLMIAAYAWSEWRVNRNLRNADRQYILQSKWVNPNNGLELTTFGALAKELKEQYPNLVANYYRWDGISSNVSKGALKFREGIQLCDSTMLSMYGFRLLQGDAATAFDGPYSVVITADRAKKYFGRTNVVGETLNIEDFSGSRHDFQVTGVLQNLSRNSATFLNDDNDNQIYISSKNISYFNRIMDWNTIYIPSYVELQPGVDPRDLIAPMEKLIAANAPAAVGRVHPYAISLKEYYLSANNGIVRKMLITISIIAFFILLMAIVNFMNMAVSRAVSRMREIGVRKVMGGVRKQLILQFLIESIVLVLFATLLAIGLYALLNELMSGILGKKVPSLGEFPVYFILFPAILVIVLGTVAGLYPALVLSSMRSVESLKGKLTVKDNLFLRKSLVVFQFGTAIIVFIGALVISGQVNLFFSKDIGFNKEAVLAVQLPRNWTPEGLQRMMTVRRELSELPEVKQVSLSFEVPDGNNAGSMFIYRSDRDSTTAVTSQRMMTDEFYAATYEIPMIAGEYFAAPGTLTDPLKVVINETQAKALGWDVPADAIGATVRVIGNPSPFTVAGVIKDFHFGTMRNAIQSVSVIPVQLSNTYRVLSIRLKPGDIAGSINALQKKWSATFPMAPFEYKFMDESLAKLYRTELQLKKASYTATILSFIIVLSGVIGLVSLSIRKRTKEIGIRKVLGSSVAGIIALFLRDFMAVLLIAGVIACPLAYFLMNRWLNDYVYRIDLTATPFIIALSILAGITVLLIILQTVRTALRSPVKSLRAE